MRQYTACQIHCIDFVHWPKNTFATSAFASSLFCAKKFYVARSSSLNRWVSELKRNLAVALTILKDMAETPSEPSQDHGKNQQHLRCSTSAGETKWCRAALWPMEGSNHHRRNSWKATAKTPGDLLANQILHHCNFLILLVRPRIPDLYILAHVSSLAWTGYIRPPMSTWISCSH